MASHDLSMPFEGSDEKIITIINPSACFCPHACRVLDRFEHMVIHALVRVAFTEDQGKALALRASSLIQSLGRIIPIRAGKVQCHKTTHYFSRSHC